MFINHNDEFDNYSFYYNPSVALIFIQTTHINVGPYSYSNRADDPVIGVD